MELSFWKLVIILVAIIIIFGTKRIPQVMEDLAKGIKTFKRGMEEDDVPAPKRITAKKKKSTPKKKS